MKNRMPEAEWVASEDSYRMLRPCRRIIRYHPRKGRLFAVACCYRIWHLLADPRSRAAVEVAAEYADGLVSGERLRAAEVAAAAAHNDAFRAKGKVGACAEWAAAFAASADAWHAASRASNFAYVAAGDGLEPGPEHAGQSHLLRCIFGPLPFRDIPFDPAWRTSAVLALARGAYDHRILPHGTLEPDRLAILADALEEAGCADREILGHLRGPGVHVRGCWAVDLMLTQDPTMSSTTKRLANQRRFPKRLRFRETCLGEITDVAGSFPWMEGTLKPSSDAALFQAFFRWMVDEGNRGQDPPFDEALLDENNWFVEEDDGNTIGITVPAVHEDGSLAWRWR